jgi:ATP-dependent 26S proteasome regulatory subunit
MKINLESKIDQDISLSDLLNVVNEIAFAESVVLIMSTNHSKKLDDALIRDDRVDLKIEFTLSRKKELRRLFIQMYRSFFKTAVFTELDDMTKAFATRLSKNTFSVTKIQRFLLN